MKTHDPNPEHSVLMGLVWLGILAVLTLGLLVTYRCEIQLFIHNVTKP